MQRKGAASANQLHDGIIRQSLHGHAHFETKQKHGNTLRWGFLLDFLIMITKDTSWLVENLIC